MMPGQPCCCGSGPGLPMLWQPIRIDDRGLIHADLLGENILDDGAGLRLIDFDDCGWGFRFYDLGTAMLQSLGRPGPRRTGGGAAARLWRGARHRPPSANGG